MPVITNSEAFRSLAAKRCIATFLANEVSGQVGVRFRVDGQNQELWFNTIQLDRSTGPLLEAIRGLCGVVGCYADDRAAPCHRPPDATMV